MNYLFLLTLPYLVNEDEMHSKNDTKTINQFWKVAFDELPITLDMLKALPQASLPGTALCGSPVDTSIVSVALQP